MDPVQGRCRAAAVTAVALVCLVLPLPGSGDQPAVGQEDKVPGSIMERLDLADGFARQRKNEKALELYEEAARRAREERNALLESRAMTGRGEVLKNESKYSEAQQSFERALELAQAAGDQAAVARVTNQLGVVMENLGRMEEARSWYKRSAGAAEAAGVPRLRIRAQLNSARLENSGPIKEAACRDAAESARKLGERELEADATHSLGDTLFVRGDYAAAMGMYLRAATIYEGIGDRNDLARVYTSTGRLNRTIGRPREAIPFYEKALVIQMDSGDKMGMVQSLSAMGVAYRRLEDYRRSIECHEKAYSLALQTGSPRAIDFVRANLAESLLRHRKWARAAELLEEILRRGFESNPGVRHIQLSGAYKGMGRLAEARQQADLAVQAADQSVQTLAANLMARADIRMLQEDLPGALEDALECVRKVEGMRAKLVPLDFMKQGFSRQYQLGHSFLIGLYFRMGQPEKALAVAELTRARAFLDLLATREVRLRTVDESEVADLRRIGVALQGLGLDPFGSEQARPESNVFTPEGAALLDRWRSARPELLSFVAANPVGATGIVAVARRLRSVILSYWVAEDSLFIWAVQPGGRIDMRRVEVGEKRLAALVSSVSSIAGSGGAGPVRISPCAADWRQLYRLLILPVRRSLPQPGTRLTIIAHGPLMRLSFAALADEKGRYLLEDYPLHYAPAAALLQFTAGKRGVPGHARQLLLVADPELPSPANGEHRLARLPGAREEVSKIAQLLPPGAATILQGKAAGEHAVAAAMNRASALHFATHGIARDDQPLDSYLVLTPNAGADGRLTAQKIYGFQTHAELVVLSACRSGGDRMTGEGVAAFARAFFYAGAPSLVVSLWDVADQTAERLLPDFYALWLGGESRIEALRAAQLRLLADLRSGRVAVHTPAGDFALPESPILWAGFVLLGEP